MGFPFLTYVDEAAELYFFIPEQPASEHATDGTHKLELQVSNTTLKSCGGVPIVIGPTYSVSL